VLAGLIDPCGVVAAVNVAKILEQAVITDLEQIKNRQMHQTRKLHKVYTNFVLLSRVVVNILLFFVLISAHATGTVGCEYK